jgi:hypothetical protein
MVGFSLQSLAGMGGLHWRVVRGNLGQWGSKVEEQAKSSWASHGVGRLLGEQSPATHHFQGLQAVKRHEEAQGCRGLEGLGKEAFQA